MSSFPYPSAQFRSRSGLLSRLRFPIRSIHSRIPHRETTKDTDALLGEDISQKKVLKFSKGQNRSKSAANSRRKTGNHDL